MNIIQADAAVRSWIDQVKSPRITRALIFRFLNVANRKFFNDFGKVYQTSQDNCDDMKPFAKNNIPLTPVGDVFTYPADYEKETGFAVVVNGVRRMSTKMTYNEQNAISENAFTEASDIQPYHIESAAGVTSYYGTGNTLTQGFLSYLTIPADLYWSDTAISAGPSVLTVGSQYYVATAPVTSNSVTYAAGAIFTAGSTAFTGAGTVNAIQDFQIGGACHEDLCRYAAQELDASLKE